MNRSSMLRTVLPALFFTGALTAVASGGEPVTIETPVSPPSWALLEREVIRAATRACLEFFDRYFDDRGYLECVERWGGDDGPDDAIENLCGWPILHAVGAPDVILQRCKKAWEGHLRQYTKARTTDVEFARDGMYYKEFPVMFDWLHHDEGLTVFNFLGLSDPSDPRNRARAQRYAGFYMNEDPGAPNYDPQYKVIRSLFNGSRGPLLRKATALEWAGDPIEVEHRFQPKHGERTYKEMLAHFHDYGDVVGDHPQNLLATTLALNAYMLTHDPKYRAWLLDYVDAWCRRTAENGGIIPTKVDLDGKVASKWYGGVYGWGFTVTDPATGRPIHRNNHYLGLAGFGNAYLLTGDDRYLDIWRRQIDLVNAQKKVENGRTLYPHMHGDQGWYDYTPRPYDRGALEVWYWSMRPSDRGRLATTGWLAYLEGHEPGYPEAALRAALATIRQRVEAMRRDPTTPDTRLADDPLGFNPAAVTALIHLALGGLDPGNRGSVLHCRVRYFDPEARRAGLPEDVAALVEKLSADETVLTLVNLNQSDPRTVTVQAGGFAEHTFKTAQVDGRTFELNRPHLTVRLGPGAGGRITLATNRYANTPTLAMPWDQN
jgi:hypothetical protein